MMTTAEDILELEAGLTQIEEPQTIMELVVEVIMEDPRTLVVEDREVLELVALEEEVVVFGQELLQVIDSYQSGKQLQKSVHHQN